VLVLPARQLGSFQQRVFLGGTEIDQNDLQDDQGLASFYFVLGYSASRTQVKVSKAERHVSGGGVFHISRETKLGPLVAIGTQNRRHSRLIVATRIKHFLAIARELKAKPGSSESV
jgi:hypothetical protein